MKHYEHTENGWMIIAVTAATMGVFAVLSRLPRGVPPPVVTIVGVVMAAVLLLTFRLRTYADEGGAGFSMGIGLVRRYFPYAQIESASALKLGFMAGWGIHYAGNGWLYNVNSQQVVELKLKGGGRCLIGTDDPQGFLAAILPRLRG